jgi:hypothetical protein
MFGRLWSRVELGWYWCSNELHLPGKRPVSSWQQLFQQRCTGIKQVLKSKNIMFVKIHNKNTVHEQAMSISLSNIPVWAFYWTILARSWTRNIVNTISCIHPSTNLSGIQSFPLPLRFELVIMHICIKRNHIFLKFRRNN